jgi:aspartate carbamoyltransferase catalytic subunit
MFKHILTTQQFSDREIVEGIFQQADIFREQDKLPLNDPEIDKTRQILRNYIFASVFYEPSTRTRFSFEAAALKLGAKNISSENAAQYSSISKGESIEDSIRTIGQYVNMIIMRHPQQGSLAKAAGVSEVPVINAGDGIGEHPTQSILDLYTIQKELGTLDDLQIALVGDLLNGRTIHSLVQLLPIVKNPRLFLVSPEQLKIPDKYRQFLEANNIPFEESNNLDDVLPESDVVYMTRVQKERFKTKKELKVYKKTRNAFIFDQNSLDRLPAESIVMHPLPRVKEIHPEVDADKRAAYFRQVKNGLHIRMSLLKMVAEEREKNR